MKKGFVGGGNLVIESGPLHIDDHRFESFDVT